MRSFIFAVSLLVASTTAQVDTNHPVVSCIADITASLSAGSTGTSVSWTEPTATDDSGFVSTSRTRIPGSFFNAGTTTVTYTFTDGSGNTATCTFDVNVVPIGDTIAPVIACIGDVTQNVAAGVTSAVVAWTEPTATDNSGFVTLTARTHTPESTFSVGTTRVAYIFTDGAGNNAVCSFNVIVSVVSGDTTPPVIACISDITQNVATGISSTTVSWTEPTATDNLGVVSLTVRTHSPGSTFSVGTSRVTYVFTDGSGNSAACSFNVNVISGSVDTTAPIPSCTNDVLETVPVGTTSTSVIWIEPTATDNSGLVTVSSQSHVSGSQFAPGSTLVTYVFSDSSGNSATCTFSVIVLQGDSVVPVVSCINDVVATVGTGVGGTTVTWVEPTATDNSGTMTLSFRTHSPGFYFPVGSTPVTYTFSDQTGNAASCVFTVIVTEIDNIAPVVACINDVAAYVSTGVGGTTVAWTEPTATDNSGPVLLTSRTHTPSSFFPVGITQVTYTFIDGSGNSATCTFTVRVIEADTIGPVVTCIGDVTRNVDSGIGGTIVTWNEPTATDNSGPATLLSKTHTPGSFFQVGNTPVTYTFTDGSGNTATCSFNVLVIGLDTIPPVVTCINDVTTSVSNGIGSTIVAWTEPTATDNSGTVTLTSRTHTPGSFYPVGITQVTYIFTDGSGNRATCTFNVRVTELDSIAPVIDCINDVSTTVLLGTTSAIMTWVEPTATDNFGVTTLASRSHSPGSLFPVGITQVTYVFRDAAGNTASCSFAVTVATVDTIRPVVACIDDVTETVSTGASGRTVTWTPPTATDNSGTVNLVSRTNAPGSFFLLGSTQVMYTFQDGSGNSATCTFTVSVFELDTINPVVTCIGDIAETVNSGITGKTVSWAEPSATDNSGPATLSSRSHAPRSFFQVGTTRVTYIFTDDSGNSASCSFDVTVTEIDTIPPVIACIGDITTTVPAGTFGTTVSWTEPTATDNSGMVNRSTRTHAPGAFFLVGDTDVTYTFTDGSGNLAICSFTVNVIEVDTTLPTATCPKDISRTIPAGSGPVSISWNEPSTSDNSGVVNIVSRSKIPGSLFNTGTTNVIYIYSDPSGNTGSCSFLVTVIEGDTVAPMVFCPEDIVVTVLTGVGGTNINFIAPTAVDSSGSTRLISQTHQPGDFFAIGTTTVTYRYSDDSGNVESCSFTVTVQDVDPCFNNPCLNGGTCVIESLIDYTCLCQNCFNGQNCEVAQDACVVNPCSNGAACIPVSGSCTQYQCQCTDCYFGQFCTQRVDPCDNHQCQSGGQCQPDVNGCTVYYCQCPSCYSGQFCQTQYNACTNSRCQNGGQCTPILNGACTEYTCSCGGCNTGQFCEVERDPCANNPCGNNGVCSAVLGSCTVYTCECQGCFTGYNCELSFSSPCLDNPCLNGGQCSAIAGQCIAYSCTCPPGYTGVNCEQIATTNINPCNSFPCFNGGSCLTMDSNYYVCMCPDGFLGIFCQTPKENQPFNDGCVNSPCVNGATCYNSFNSNNNLNGIFNRQYSCVCASSFTGTNCAQTTATNPSLDICGTGNRPNCDNGGVCYNAYHSYDSDVDYFCNCREGFIGHNCETLYFDPCSSNPCLNGAQCSSLTTYFTCQCGNRYTGTTCNIDLDADHIPPVISNAPSSLYYYTTTSGYSATWTEPTASDESGTVNLIRRTHAPGAFFPLGTTAVTYVYADESNNAATVTFFITVMLSNTNGLDATPPVISNCPTRATAQAAAGASGATATWNVPTATDNSGLAPTRTSTHSPGQFFGIGTTRVVYTFSDANGNRATCEFDVIITLSGVTGDTTAPIISNCPTLATAQVAAGASGTTATWNVPFATDNSGLAPTRTSTHSPGQFFGIGTTPVTYTFSDANGNRATCEFDVIITLSGVTGDTTAPIISNCPTLATAQVAAGASGTTATWNVPFATDNSGLAPTRTSTHSPGQFFGIGTTPVTYTFSDANGNRATCEFDVIITLSGVTGDTTAPIISNCPTLATAQVAAGASGTTATWNVPFATDNSGLAPTRTSTHSPGQFFGIGTTPVTYTFSDADGNTAICQFDVVVASSGDIADIAAPVVANCPTGFTFQAALGANAATATWNVPSATDNSGLTPTRTSTHNSGQSFNIGTTRVTYTFTDQSGNSASCIFPITVVASGVTQDTVAPVISGCPADFVQYVSIGYSPVSWTEPTATDNSGTVSIEYKTYTTPNIFIGAGMTLSIEYRFADPSGNTATCAFTIASTETDTSTADTTAPVILNCPANPYTLVADGVTSAVVTWTTPTATDNVGVVSTRGSHTSGQVFQFGTTDVTYTFSDSAGNEAVCAFTVMVASNNPNSPCNSNPCQNSQSCYFTASRYVCLPELKTRRRRDVIAIANMYSPDCDCMNGGHCMSYANAGVQCRCPVRFSGILCEVNDPCLNNPCAHNGTCIGQSLELIHEMVYMCKCAQGWEGPHCFTASRVEDNASGHGDLMSNVYKDSLLSISDLIITTVFVLIMMILSLLVSRIVLCNTCSCSKTPEISVIG